MHFAPVSNRELREGTRDDGFVKGMLRRSAFRVVEKAYIQLMPDAIIDLRAAREDPAVPMRANWAEHRSSGDLNYDFDDEAVFDKKVATFLDIEAGNAIERNWLLPS